MELRQLRHFAAAVEIGNLSAASEQIYISQPALSRSIQNLEEELGVQLLERVSRGVVPTKAGELFYRRAKLILNESARVKTDVRMVEKGMVGHLKIGVAPIFARHIIDRAILNLSAAAPELSLTVTEGFFEDLVDAVRDGRIDAAFTSFAYNLHDDDLVVEPLYELSATLGVSKATAEALGPNPAIEDLAKLRWLIVDQPHAADLLEFFFSENGIQTPSNAIKTNSIALIQSLVENGPYVTFLNRHLLERAPGVALVPLEPPPLPIRRQAGLIYRKASQERPALQPFFSQIRAACAAAKA
ncbi:MAG: LysR family transcriptional regulator [Pseudomonadota bacterium]